MAIYSAEPRQYVEPSIRNAANANGITSPARRKRNGSSSAGIPEHSAKIPEIATAEDPSERNDLLRDFVNAHKELESYK